MQKNVTIRLSEEAADWARIEAAKRKTSVSRMVGEMLEREMKGSSEYWRAYERWKEAMANLPAVKPEPGFRFNREETHDRALHRRMHRD